MYFKKRVKLWGASSMLTLLILTLAAAYDFNAVTELRIQIY